jgi:RES domain-containing protein
MAAVIGPAWDATTAIRACPREPWVGFVWRVHASRFDGNNADGSLIVSGRFNRGHDKFDPAASWKALYTSLAPEVALAERIRHFTPDNLLHKVKNQRLSRLRVDLQAVIRTCASSGCRNLDVPGLNQDDLCHPTNYEKAQELAWAVQDCGAEGLMVPSCTRLPQGNLIVFPDNLRNGSIVSVESYEDPNLAAG